MKSAVEPRPNELTDLRQIIKTLSRPNTPMAVYHLLEIWGVIALAWYCSVVVWPTASGATGLIVYLVVVTVIASRQHALMVLTHDGIHKRLSHSLWFNDGCAR